MPKQPKVRGRYEIRVIDSEGVIHNLEVSRETFLAYYKMFRRERYLRERDTKNGVCSFDSSLRGYGEGASTPRGFYETVADEETTLEFIQETARLEELCQVAEHLVRTAFKQMDKPSADLLCDLYVKELSLRQCGEKYGVSHTAIAKRRNKALATMRVLIEDMVVLLDEELAEDLYRQYNIKVEKQ